MIYAPFSAWTTTNTVCFAGSIVAGSFLANNKVTFTGAGGSTNGQALAVYPSAYTQFPSKYSGDPGSGCY